MQAALRKSHDANIVAALGVVSALAESEDSVELLTTGQFFGTRGASRSKSGATSANDLPRPPVRRLMVHPLKSFAPPARRVWSCLRVYHCSTVTFCPAEVVCSGGSMMMQKQRSLPVELKATRKRIVSLSSAALCGLRLTSGAQRWLKLVNVPTKSLDVEFLGSARPPFIQGIAVSSFAPCLSLPSGCTCKSYP